MKTKSQAAQVAALVKANLKKHGIACSVKSSYFSMGNSVDVRVYDQRPETVAKIREYCEQFKDGYFDGMQDMYIYNKDRRNGPTTKYLHIKNEISAELRAECVAWVNQNWTTNISEWEKEEIINRQLYNAEGFWRDRKPRLMAA